MNPLKNLLIGVIALFIFSSCEKDSEPFKPYPSSKDLSANMDTVQKYIHGTWRWVVSYMSDRYTGIQYSTPYTDGWNHRSMKLFGDTLQFFNNYRLDSTYQFKIQRMSDVFTYETDTTPALLFYSLYNGQRRGTVMIHVCKDQLAMIRHNSWHLWVRK